jgi:hypothetical protein
VTPCQGDHCRLDSRVALLMWGVLPGKIRVRGFGEFVIRPEALGVRLQGPARVARCNINQRFDFRHPAVAATRLPSPGRRPEKVLTVSSRPDLD